MKVYRFAAMLFIGTSIVLVACGDTNPPPPPPTGNVTPPPAQNQTTPQAGYVEILITGRNFNPDSLTVAAGTIVNWVSKDGEVHTVSSDIPNLFNGTIDPFGSFVFTFNQTGDFEYFCGIHGQMGMRGVIHVK